MKPGFLRKTEYLLLSAAILLAGCVTQTTEVKTATFDQQLPKPQADYTSGSIWQAYSAGVTEDFKARRRGDTVTIVITETASASKAATTDTKRGTAVSAGAPYVMGLESALELLGGKKDNLLSANVDSKYSGSGSTTRKESLNATITAKVVDVLPNGNLQLEGRRNVKVNNEDQIIVIEGTVRPADIGPDNVVNSIYIADARISYSGKGIISDRQSPGWLMNFIDKIWPF